METFVYPYFIAIAPLIIALLLKSFKRKVAQKFPGFLIIILVIAFGIFCTFTSMIVSANGMAESMQGTQEPKCTTGAALFFPIGIMATVFGVLMNTKKKVTVF